jgi:hypothetical protein
VGSSPDSPKLSKSDAARLNGRKGGRPRKHARPESVAGETHSTPPVETQAKPKTHKTQPDTKPVPAALDNPFDLEPRELLFVEAYCGPAHFVGAEAYRLAGFEGTDDSIRQGASHMLTRANVQAAISAKLAERVKRFALADEDECLRRTSIRARGDIRRVLDPDDPLAQLPDDVALSIKAVKYTEHGRNIELYDTHREAALLMKVSGRLSAVERSSQKQGARSLEDILAEANQAEREGQAAHG